MGSVAGAAWDSDSTAPLEGSHSACAADPQLGPSHDSVRGRTLRTEKRRPQIGDGVSLGAEHETRTRDLHHGKVALYQLS